MRSRKVDTRDSSPPGTGFLMQRKRTSHTVADSNVPDSLLDVVDSPGQPLDAGSRETMEARFGTDFEKVRVHKDAAAADAAASVGAAAYTIGEHLLFGRNQYQPQNSAGQGLLAHELTHVMQQRGANATGSRGRLELDPSPALEAQAEAAGRATQSEEPTRAVSTGLSSVGIQRQAAPSLTQKKSAKSEFDKRFTHQELEKYLALLDSTNDVENKFFSDDKARVIVKHWKRGDPWYILTQRRKHLLIKEMLGGFVSTEDEQAILGLLSGATDAELASLIKLLGFKNLAARFDGTERKQLDADVPKRLKAGVPKSVAAQTFDDETILSTSKEFQENALITLEPPKKESDRVAGTKYRENCIRIIRKIAPKLFGRDPKFGKRSAKAIGKLKLKGRGKQDLRMSNAMRELKAIRAAGTPKTVKFNNRNGSGGAPTAFKANKPWATLMSMVPKQQGWHVFGVSVLDGYHSATVLVDVRGDATMVYWADQWRVETGDTLREAPGGGVSGMRRYEESGFDQHILDYTKDWWEGVWKKKKTKFTATFTMWKLFSQKGPK